MGMNKRRRNRINRILWGSFALHSVILMLLIILILLTERLVYGVLILLWLLLAVELIGDE